MSGEGLSIDGIFLLHPCIAKEGERAKGDYSAALTSHIKPLIPFLRALLSLLNHFLKDLPSHWTKFWLIRSDHRTHIEKGDICY